MSKIHIVGAGVAGLSAAVRLAGSGRQIFLYESAGHAGGRCRSYFDIHLGCRIDNGNHLLLSGNPSVHEYLSKIGASRELIGPERAIFPFIDLSVSKTWTVEIGKSSFPLWLLKKDRRIPDTGISDYLTALRLLFADEDQTLGDIVDTHAPLYHRFFEPFAVGVLNTPAEVSSARLLATVLKETFARGADACMPRMAKVGLSETFVDPALTYLKERGVVYRDNTRLREIVVEAQRTTQLRFSNSEIEVSRDDIVVLATPAPVTAILIPDLTVPVDTYPIVNAHFRVPDKIQLASDAGLIGIVGGTAQWLFFRGDIISATVSAADELADAPAAYIAQAIWSDITRSIDGVPKEMPEKYRVVKERRATISQTPESNRMRPTSICYLENLLLAGDWTNTGLPATIEGSIKSGNSAADIILTR